LPVKRNALISRIKQKRIFAVNKKLLSIKLSGTLDRF
jgi:hypothetical protein